jgi:integrase
MKLADRQLVEGTEPCIYIGHRVRRDPRSGKQVPCKPWYAEWNEHGVKRSKALGTPNKKVAIRRAHEICRRILVGEQAKPKQVSLHRLAEQYLAMQRAQGRAPTTLTKYTQVLESKLIPWAHEHDIRLAQNLRERHFWEFSETLSSLAPKTRYTMLTIVKQLFRWADREGLLAQNPIARCKLREPEPTERHCFTADQVAIMLERADDHLRPLIRFFSLTGCRFGEARDLEWSTVDLNAGKHGVLTIRRGGSTDTTKSRRSRRIPVHPDLQVEFEQMKRVAGSNRVFHERPTAQYPGPDRTLVERLLLGAIKRLARDCGFPNWKQACIHSFRHYFASELARHGVTEFTALSLMGQRSSDVLHRYQHPHDDDMERAISRLEGPIPSPIKKIGNKRRNRDAS